MVSDEPLDDRCSESLENGYCEGWPMDNGLCQAHGGRNYDNNGAPEGNKNASDHNAFSEHFKSDLTKAETNAFDAAKERLESPDSAQEIAREVAAELLLKYKRSGDERFITRFENVCDKFGLVPDDELNVTHSLGDMWEEDLSD